MKTPRSLKAPGSNHVVLFASTLNQAGGGERLLLELERGLVLVGVEVTIIVLDYHPRAMLEGKYRPGNLIVLGALPKGLFAGFGWLRALWRLRRAVLHRRASHVIAQSENNAIFVRLALLGCPVPYSVQIFGQMFQFPSDHTKYARIFRQHCETIRRSTEGYLKTIPASKPPTGLVASAANEIIAIARYFVVRSAHARFVVSRQVAWETSLLYRRSCTLLRGAYRDEIFSVPGRTRQSGTLLSLSRLVPKKNVDLALEAFALVAKENRTYRLLIGGTGPERERLERRVGELDLRSQVQFLGYIQESELEGLYQSCAAFVMLDVADYNITLYEALALGAPVVLSRDQEVDPAIADSAMLFTSSLAIEAIAEQMRKVLGLEAAPQLSAKDRDYLRGISWESYARHIRDEIFHAG